MGVYINIEMPPNCSACWALDDYGDYPRCRITEEQRGYNFPIREKRMDNCPLTPVPPHGRLIDADAFGTPGTIEEDTLWRGRIETEVYLASTIYNAPTIIPAEPCKEKGE